ncbi:MAG: MFS transporter [Chloroflexi bacterium]|nr:MFS transporter [Chloroflexota bacterium]
MTQHSYTPPPHGWRTFLIVWATQSVSVFGSALTIFAINIWLITTCQGSRHREQNLHFDNAHLGHDIVNILRRYESRLKATMILCDVGNGVAVSILLALIFTHQFNVPMLIVLVFVQAMITSFHNAAFDTSYAMLVPEEKLPRANGMMQTIFSLSGIVSPAVAATLIALPSLARQGSLPSLFAPLGAIQDGAVLAVSVDALTFFAAAVVPIFLFIPSPTRTDLHTATGAKKSLWADVKEGALYIWHRRSFLWLLGTFTVANFSAGAFVLMPLIVKFQLEADRMARGFSIEAALALLNTAGSVGGVIGGVAISMWGGLKKNRVYGVLTPMIFAGIALMVTGASPWLFLTAAALAFSQGLVPFMNAHSQTIWQTQVPRELQGRVFSVRRLIAQFSWPASTLIMGALASRFEPGLLVMALGLIFALAAASGLINPYLRRVEDKEWIEAQALKNMGRVAAD